MRLKSNFIFFILLYQTHLFANDLSWFIPPTIDEIKKKKTISIVFVSQNLKSPISMFGHTLIVAHNEVIPEPDAITIEFLGDTSGAENGHLSALFSSIHGYYKLNHFLIKQREYEEENRDFWIYNIEFSNLARNIFNEEVERRLSNEYRYNFISKNCSYYVLDLIAKSEDELQASSSGFFYTLPVDTIRVLRSKNLIYDSIYLASSQKALLKRYDMLSKDEQVDFHTILSGQNVISFTDESLNLKSTLSKAISYRISREPNKEMRTTLYRLKLKYPMINTENEQSTVGADPSKTLGETSLHLGYDINKTNWLVIFKPVQRDFFSSKNDGLENSYMDISKFWIDVKNNNIKLIQFNLFKIESIKEETKFSDSYNRYIDLSYYDWSNLTGENSFETVMRIGGGWSFKYSNFRFGVLPYFGISASKSIERSSTNFDLGSKVIINQWISEGFRIEGSYIYYHNSSFSFNSLINISTVATLNSKFNFGTSYLTTNEDKISSFVASLIMFL